MCPQHEAEDLCSSVIVLLFSQGHLLCNQQNISQSSSETPFDGLQLNVDVISLSAVNRHVLTYAKNLDENSFVFITHDYRGLPLSPR